LSIYESVIEVLWQRPAIARNIARKTHAAQLAQQRAGGEGPSGRELPAIIRDVQKYLYSMNRKAECVERLLSSIHARRGIHHVVYRVESGEGEVLVDDARGFADAGGRKITSDTPFFIASIDKMMTASVIMQLVEERRIDLDEYIVRYLDDRHTTGLHVWRGEDVTSRITIRNLLSHTSGLAEWLEDRPSGGKSLVEEIIEHGDREVDFDASVERIRELKPHFAPASRSERPRRARYSDSNFMLLQLIIELVERRPIGEVFRGRIFEPLELQQTWMLGEEDSETRKSPAALWMGEDELNAPAFLKSIRSVYSTTEDLIAFYRALLAGRLHRSRETVQTMHSDWTRFGFAVDPAALRSPGWPIEYGLGVKRFQIPRFVPPFRRFPYVTGHSGSTGTWLFHCPDLDVFIAGGVSQVTAGAVPYRTLGAQLTCIRSMIGR
jgi:D-alanyl-D-alanine carboxypeptidase